MELWQQIAGFTLENASQTRPDQWNFRYLEITGRHLGPPRSINDVCERIPKLQIETRARYVKPKEQSRVATLFKYTSPRRPKSPPRSIKEKIVTVKVVVAKKDDKTPKRNCICSCQDNASFKSSRKQLAAETSEDDEDDIEISYEELLGVIESYDRGVQKEATSAITRLVRRLSGGKILTESDAVKTLKMLDTDNSAVQGGILILLTKLSEGAINAKSLLEHSIMDDLIYLMLLGATAHVQIEAARCIAQLTKREEHAQLWMETMVISGTEALFGVLTAQEPVPDELRDVALTAVNHLASHAQMAQLLIEFGLDGVVQSLAHKRHAIEVLNSIISHDVISCERFLAKHEAEVLPRILNVLQYNTCPQQQEAVRFLATLTLFKPGIQPVITHHALGHLLWAMTCSYCRFVRDHASRAMKNIINNPDKTAVLEALTDLSTSHDSINTHASITAGITVDTTRLLNKFLNNPKASKLEKAVAEMVSVLSLAFQTDSLSICGNKRTLCISEPVNKAVKGFTKGKIAKPNNPDARYLSSLRVLTNTVVAMVNLIRLTDRDENGNEKTCTQASGANPSLAALLIQYGGIRLFTQLQFLSSKLQHINPPSFHAIDPTTLPPKDLVSTMKNARTELIFASTKPKQETRKQYPSFGFHSTELNFVRETINFLLYLVKATASSFDPSVEDLNVFESKPVRTSHSKGKHLSFKASASMVRNAVRFTRIAQAHQEDSGKEKKKSGKGRKSRSRPLSSRASVGSRDTAMPVRSAPSPSPITTTVAPPALTGSLGSTSQDETAHYIKQSLLDAKVISHLAPWVTCGIYDIQTSVIKVIRYLMHVQKKSKQASGHQAQPREAWGQDPPAQTRANIQSQRPTSSVPGNSKTKSVHLGHVSARHVVQYCGAYLLDLLGPPAAPGLGRASLMVIREAVINGEDDSRLKLVKLGCFNRIIDYIRGNEQEAEYQALGLVVVRSLVSSDQSLKQLFFAHGGMSLVMALNDYKEGLVKEEAGYTLTSFAKAVTSPSYMRSKRAAGRSKKRSRTHTDEDVWDHVVEKWKGQDKVVKVLKKFNVRY
ncbi:predicted protein [Nematostella vectensis]|uniref:Uncharacterized protein n=1 Tax=Nematostella vectensis TaxID=45351 RepID=A7SVV3_NEMVE|nr:predicted protein [Nematostella vectensis]|eukprot:XP_001624267.1 predicted protein [Nematostella vectensis]